MQKYLNLALFGAAKIRNSSPMKEAGINRLRKQPPIEDGRFDQAVACSWLQKAVGLNPCGSLTSKAPPEDVGPEKSRVKQWRVAERDAKAPRGIATPPLAYGVLPHHDRPRI